MLKKDLQKDDILCAKDFISLHLQTLDLKCSQRIEDKKIIALVWKLTPY